MKRFAGFLLIGLALLPILAGLVYKIGIMDTTLILLVSVIISWMIVTGVKLTLE